MAERGIDQRWSYTNTFFLHQKQISKFGTLHLAPLPKDGAPDDYSVLPPSLAH